MRRTLHGAAGDLLEARAADPDDIAEVLSLHFAQAQRPDKAWRYARIGGERAAAKYAYAQAEELYARAVQAAGRVRDIPATELVEVNTALGDARYRIGRHEQALEAFRAARRRLHGDPAQAALLLRREASIDFRRGRLRAGLIRLTRALKQLDDDPAPHPAVRSRLEGMYAGIRYQQGQYEQALSWARRAERHAEESGDLAARAEALQAVLTALAMLGYTAETASYAHNAVALYEQLGDRAGQSRALNNLAMLAWLDGHGLEALDTFRRAVELATEAGDTANAATFQYNVGDVLLHLGQAEAARELLRELLPTLRSFALDDWVASATRALGAAVALSGSLEEGTELLQHARERLDDLGEPTEVVETDAALALVNLMRGAPAIAADIAAQAAQRAKALDAVQLLAWSLRVQGGALSDLGNLSGARSLLLRALEIADKHSRGERGFVLAELSRVEDRLGSRDAAEDYAQRAEAAFVELGYAGSDRYPRA
jgi:tetratricopeptide (TPR) repeat protein